MFENGPPVDPHMSDVFKAAEQQFAINEESGVKYVFTTNDFLNTIFA